MKFNRIMAIAIMAILLIVFATSAEKRAAGTPLRIEGALKSKEIAAPGTPANGYGYWYFTTAGLATAVNDSGVSTTLGTTDSIWGHGAIITTDISPILADEDVLLDDGSTLGWGAANPGAIDVWLTRISDGILSITGTAAAAGLRYLEAAANGTNYTAWDAPANLAGNVTTHMFGTGLSAGDTVVATATNQMGAVAKSTVPGVAFRNTGASNLGAWGPVDVLLYTAVAASPAHLGTTAAETALTPAAVEGTATIPVAAFLAGENFDYNAALTVLSDADGDETLTINLYFGAQLVGTSGAIAADGNTKWYIDGHVKLKTIGAASTAVYEAMFANGVVVPAISCVAITAGDNFDLTSTKAFTIKADWGGTTDAADSVVLEDLTLHANNVD